jgi:hypothetical protein
MSRQQLAIAVSLAACVFSFVSAVNPVRIEMLLAPPAEYNASMITTGLPVNITAALNVPLSRVNLTRLVALENTTTNTYNVSLVIYPAVITLNVTSNYSQATPVELAALFHDMLHNATAVGRDAEYLAFLQNYNINATTLVVAEVTTVAPTVPVTTTAPRTNNTNVTIPATTRTTAPITHTPPTAAPPVTVLTPNSTEAYAPITDEESSNGIIYAVIFGVIGVLVIVGGVTFCIKKFATREKSDTSKRGGGFKYARGQHA